MENKTSYVIKGDTLIIALIVAIAFLLALDLRYLNRMSTLEKNVSVLQEKVAWTESEILDYKNQRDKKFYDNLGDK